MKVRLLHIVAAAGLLAARPLPAQTPAFDCDKAEGEVEKAICADSTLAALDVAMDAVWRQVLELSNGDIDLKTVQAEQRGWIKGRNDCWKSDDVRACIESGYKLRMAELQARWRLVPAHGPVFFTCGDNPADEIVATFFETDPPVALLERGDQTVVAYLHPSASGSRYEGRNVTFWMKGAEARVVWGWEAEEMRCRVR